MQIPKIISFLLLLSISFATPQWSVDKAWQMFNAQNWKAGANFIPSTAVNQLEMWQPDTFDTKTIEREITYSQLIGFDLLRVFLHIRPYLDNPPGFLDRINTFLTIASKHHHKVIFVFFDDSGNPKYSSGKQPDPIPGVHNSQWVQCPGDTKYSDQELKSYVQNIMREFGKDSRVIMWDLYNEVGNSGRGNDSLPLLKNAYAWAREIDLIQPLTCGTYNSDTAFNEINSLIVSNIDIFSFQMYCDVECTKDAIKLVKAVGRPAVVSEYMARQMDSTFITHLPVLKAERMWAISMGLVYGRTQTYYPWWSKQGDPEPSIWFHDVFWPNGTAFDSRETDFISDITQ